MISINVESVSIDGLIEIINTRQFSSLTEIDCLLRDYFNEQINLAKIEVEEKICRINNSKKVLAEVEMKREFEALSDYFDQIILQREGYFDLIEKKYKYKGRYKYGNAKGTTRHGKVSNNRQDKAPEQLCLM